MMIFKSAGSLLEKVRKQISPGHFFQIGKLYFIGSGTSSRNFAGLREKEEGSISVLRTGSIGHIYTENKKLKFSDAAVL